MFQLYQKTDQLLDNSQHLPDNTNQSSTYRSYNDSQIANLVNATRQLDSQDGGCSHDRAWVAILVSVIPLWAIITTLIVLALLLFHKHIRLTKIYDNCTKQSANYVYHVELRTGDTSATYIRRKTTITIDMFDENQVTLARIAIPGNVIFGRKDDPVAYLDDDKYFELRVTRMWLYRSSRLRRVSTIRLTHTCMEPEARIMIYGVELRLDEPDRNKLFFPVMNYITPYGTANKINACFDFDPIGSISAMGGRIEPTLISEQLSLVDMTLLVYLFGALVFFLCNYELLSGAFKEITKATFKGALIGCVCFAGTGLTALVLRYAIKYQYSMHVGAGFWSYVYHAANMLIVIAATALWIKATLVAYTTTCSNDYSLWGLSMSVAAAAGFAFTIICSLIAWLFIIWHPVNTEQFVLPDDSNGTVNPSREQEQTKDGPPAPVQQGQPQQPQQQGTRNLGEHVSKSSRPNAATRQTPPVVNASPSALLMPAMTASNVTGLQPQAWQPPAHQPGVQPMPMIMPHGYSPYPMYMQHPPPPQQQHQTGYKGAGYPGYDPAGHYQQQHAPPPAPPPAAAGPTRLPTLHHTPPGQTYHQQTTGGTAGKTTSGRTKQTKKTGSAESTGSTYYQQLMKNKGGVKSISQYGELMKAKKKQKKENKE